MRRCSTTCCSRGRSHREDKIAEYRKALEKWSVDLDRAALESWSVTGFWSTVRRMHSINQGAQNFVNQWIDHARSGALDVREHGVPVDDSAAARLVRKREKALKREWSRFRNRRMLDQWSGSAGVYRMDYRWYTVREYLRELAAGLGRG